MLCESDGWNWINNILIKRFVSSHSPARFSSLSSGCRGLLTLPISTTLCAMCSTFELDRPAENGINDQAADAFTVRVIFFFINCIIPPSPYLFESSAEIAFPGSVLLIFLSIDTQILFICSPSTFYSWKISGFSIHYPTDIYFVASLENCWRARTAMQNSNFHSPRCWTRIERYVSVHVWIRKWMGREMIIMWANGTFDLTFWLHTTYSVESTNLVRFASFVRIAVFLSLHNTILNNSLNRLSIDWLKKWLSQGENICEKETVSLPRSR